MLSSDASVCSNSRFTVKWIWEAAQKEQHRGRQLNGSSSYIYLHEAHQSVCWRGRSRRRRRMGAADENLTGPPESGCVKCREVCFTYFPITTKVSDMYPHTQRRSVNYENLQTVDRHSKEEKIQRHQLACLAGHLCLKKTRNVLLLLNGFRVPDLQFFF